MPSGTKNHCYRNIINLIPPHDVYIETHLYTGAVMRNKSPARVNIGIDINPAIIPQYASSIVNDGDSLDDTAIYDGVDIQARCRHISPYMAGVADTAIADGGAGFFFLTADAHSFLESYPFTGGEFVYLDPPYLLEARRSQRPIYAYEYTRQQHVELLEIIRGLPCNVAISGYKSEMYDRHLKGWRLVTFEAMTRGGKLATECVWMNYPPPVALHDYRYLGGDYRERERIKRKAKRWRQRFDKLPILERQAIVKELRDAGIV